MKSRFLGGSVWGAITASSRAHKGPSDVAVAYFGQGVTKLLTLARGSRLVVDASEQAVKSGQTHPASLLALHRKGVSIFSVKNLHAKVFVFGRTAFIGSANVSERSARQLFEAVVRTTDTRVVRDARDFVRESCIDPLRTEHLRTLQGIYEPPKIAGGKEGARCHKSGRRSVSRCFIAHTGPVELDQDEARPIDKGKKLARKLMIHPRSNDLDWFLCRGRVFYQLGDLVIQADKPASKSIFFAAPARVIRLQKALWDGDPATAVYLEIPPYPRKTLAALTRAIGRGAKRKLLRDGMVRDPDFKEKLLQILNG